jgi:hypothetical protein
MKATLNENSFEINTEQDLAAYLDALSSVEYAEAWLNHDMKESICLLKAESHMFLMYLRYPEDAGFVSKGHAQSKGNIEFRLSNGQADEYPLSWCIESEWAYKGLAYFYENNGEKSPYIEWQAE